MFYKDLESRKELVRNFIRENPKTTYKDIRKKLKIHPERLYKKGMSEAFKDAGILPPRTFVRKTKEEKRQILIGYVRKNPKVGGQTIRSDTKINFLNIFKDTEEMFEAAGIDYPRKEFRALRNREIELKKKQIIEAVRNDPLLSIDKISRQLKTHPYSLFKNTKEIYNLAKTPFIDRGSKRRIKKRNQVIDYVKNNPFATQREINNACKTHVQGLFKNGIFDAYKEAGIEFPYNRLKIYGVGIKEIRKRAKAFEEEIANKLSNYGKVSRLIKTTRGFADIILEINNQKLVIEIKDYKLKDISISQIKQLNKYLDDENCNFGILICHKKPKKDRFLIGKNTILIIEESEINKIPNIIQGTVC